MIKLVCLLICVSKLETYKSSFDSFVILIWFKLLYGYVMHDLLFYSRVLHVHVFVSMNKQNCFFFKCQSAVGKWHAKMRK